MVYFCSRRSTKIIRIFSTTLGKYIISCWGRGRLYNLNPLCYTNPNKLYCLPLQQFVQRVVYQKQPQYIQQPQPQPQQYIPQYNRNPYIYTTTKQSTGYNPNKRYMPTWPKLRGHCNKPPPFKIKVGLTLLLFIFSWRCKCGNYMYLEDGYSHVARKYIHEGHFGANF